MNAPKLKFPFFKALLPLALLVGGGGAYAAQVVGTVINLSGPLLAKRADGTVKVLALKSEVEQGDLLISENGTYGRIKFVDNSEITLKPNSQMKIENFSFDDAKPEQDSAIFSLIKGGLRSVTGLLGKRSKERFGMNTPTATIGIRGTTFVAQYVAEGEVVESVQTVQADGARSAGPTAESFAAYTMASMVAAGGGTVSDAGPSYAPLHFLPPLQVAQTHTPGSGGGLAPGLYVHVIDGLISLSNRGGVQQFASGQFGFTGSILQPPVIVPNNPGLQFSPPPAFQSNTGSQGSTNPPPKEKQVDCEVR